MRRGSIALAQASSRPEAPLFGARIRSLLAALACGITGCGGMAMEDPEPSALEVGRSELALVDNPTTTASYETVFIRARPGALSRIRCSGIALSDRWVLTAAHCVYGMSSARVEVCSGFCDNSWPDLPGDIFEGDAHFYVHPDYDDDPLIQHDTGDDIALIRLEGAGMQGSPRGRFYADDRLPWYDPGSPFSGISEEQRFSIIGYGYGSYPDGNDCDPEDPSLTLGIKRISEGNYVVKRNFLPDSVSTVYSDHGVCNGDSGSPWQLERGGQRLTFALSSNRGLFIYHEANGTLIPNKWNWIEETAEEEGAPLECHQYYAAGYRYSRCEDKPVFIGLDAELGALVAPMLVKQDNLASRAKYVTVPETAGTAGYVTHEFEIPRAGYYRIWGRVLAPSMSDAFYVSMDGALIKWDLPRVENWVWRAVNDDGVQDPAIFLLSAGTHTIAVGAGPAEAGARLDRLIITDAALWRPWETRLEAESGGLTPPMTSVLSLQAGYIEVPDGSGPGGMAAYNLYAMPGGYYYAWGRTLARDQLHDKFYVTLDDGPRHVYEAPINDGEWSWSRVNHWGQNIRFGREPGHHALFIERRSTGVRLDEILVTNDAGFVPKTVSTKQVLQGSNAANDSTPFLSDSAPAVPNRAPAAR